MLESKSGSVTSATFNLLNATLGAGILAVPFAFKSFGVIFGPITLSIAAIVSIISGIFLVQVSLATGKNSYKSIAHHLLGRFGGPIFEMFVFLLAFGGVLYYYMVVGDLIPDLIRKGFGDHWYTSREFVLAIIMLLIIIPLSIMKNFNFLSFTSAVATLCAGLIVGFVVLRFVIRATEGKIDWKATKLVPTNAIEMFMTFPILVFAFAYQISIVCY